MQFVPSQFSDRWRECGHFKDPARTECSGENFSRMTCCPACNTGFLYARHKYRHVTYCAKNDVPRFFMSDNDRPTFSIDGKPYVSAGVLIYTVRYPTIYFLMQKVDDPRWNKYDTLSWEWEDMGGKSDKADQTIQDVAFRECQEETNGVITRSQLVEFTKDARSFEYCVHESKYMLHVLYVDPVKLDEWGVELFGTVEQHTGIQRTIQWTTYANLQIYYNTGILHPRLAPVVSSLILHISERQKGHYPSALKPKKTVPYKK